jgi:serine/threonine protein kinase
MRGTRKRHMRNLSRKKRGGERREPLPRQTAPFSSESIPCFGESGSLNLKAIMLNPDSVRSNPVQEQYELKTVFGGGKSGAYVFLIKNRDTSANQTFILKFYPNSLRVTAAANKKAAAVANTKALSNTLFQKTKNLQEINAPETREWVEGYRSKLPRYMNKEYEAMNMPDQRCDATGNKLADFDERPFREVLALCALQGKPGFSALYEYGIMDTPVNWVPILTKAAPRGLYIIMSLAQGRSLSEIDFSFKTPMFGAIISWKLLNIMDTMKSTLGPSAEHFDFHPDNIYIHMPTKDSSTCDMIQWKTPSGIKSITCPQVSIIDFDLVEGGLFHSGNRKNAFEEELPEQKTKRTGFIPVPERTLQFCIRMIGLEKTLIFMSYVKRIVNTDIRNWWIIASCLMIRTGGLSLGIQLCSDIDNCLNQNKQMFSIIHSAQFPPINSLRYYPNKKEVDIPEFLMAKQALSIVDSFMLNIWKPYDTQIFNTTVIRKNLEGRAVSVKLQEHPNFDSTCITFDLFFALYHSDLIKSTPERVFGRVLSRIPRVGFNLGNELYILFPYKTQVSILTNQLTNQRFLIRFDTGIDVDSYNEETNTNSEKQRKAINMKVTEEYGNGLRIYKTGSYGAGLSSLLYILKIIANRQTAKDVMNYLANDITMSWDDKATINDKQLLFVIRMLDIKIKEQSMKIVVHFRSEGLLDNRIVAWIASINGTLIPTNVNGIPIPEPVAVSTEGQSGWASIPLLGRLAPSTPAPAPAPAPVTRYYMLEYVMPSDPKECETLKQWECEHPRWMHDYREASKHFILENMCSTYNITLAKFVGLLFSALLAGKAKGLTLDYDVKFTYIDNKLFDKGNPYRRGEKIGLETSIGTEQEIYKEKNRTVDISKAFKGELERLEINYRELKKRAKLAGLAYQVGSLASDQYILNKIALYSLSTIREKMFSTEHLENIFVSGKQILGEGI